MKTIVLTILLLWIAVRGFAAIAFVANVDGNWDLFVVNEDGKKLTRLTTTPHDEKDPAWSQDRTQIVYATSDGELNIIDVKTKKSHRIAPDEERTAKHSACFSPDGREAAFVQFKPGGKDDTVLKIYNIETETGRILLDQFAGQFWPAWSPDGSRIIYVNNHCAGECGRLIQELWIADPKGGYARQLLMTNSMCQQPAWSPDGKRIAFSSDKGGNFDIWILDLQSRNLERVTSDESLDVSPAWSRDGKRLAFVSTKQGKMQIWIKDLATGQVERLRPFGEKEVECKDVAW